MDVHITRAIEMVCTIHIYNVMVESEHVEFTLSTIGKKDNDKTYKVVVSKFPSCTCEDFQMQARGGKRYMACKHLYFVFIKYLELDVHQQNIIHQAALIKRELHPALQFVS